MATGVTSGSVASGLSRGTNQAGVRLYNERLVLSLIRRHGSMPKAEIARATGLSPQTISIITNQLTADGLLLRGNPVRGRIGQPSVPYSLNPGGAYAFGLKIGRRSLDLILANLTGDIVASEHHTYAYPRRDEILELAMKGIEDILSSLSAEQAARVSGLGIASPYELWNWAEEMGAPQDVMDEWRRFDLRTRFAGLVPWPVYLENDATAACASEFLFGAGAAYTDYLYIFIGSFIGGGLVLNGHLFPGRNKNAGALGSMQVPMPAKSGEAGSQQLIRSASIYVLERRMQEAGLDPRVLWRVPVDWGDIGPMLDDWIEEVADSLGVATVGAISVVDVETIIIDGAFPVDVRARIVEATRGAVERTNREGLLPFEIIEGSIGATARAMGAAAIPLLANFTQDREVLFKEG